MDLAAIKSRLAGSNGRLYWRSLGQLADTPEFRDYLHREFPDQASEWNDPKGRRNFLKLMSASLALAGVGACTKQPPESIVPYVRQPEEIVPGRPLYFASAIPFSGTAMPVLVESHMGRPTKIEGNPEHPASLGGTDVLTQAAVLDLYDPDRAQTINFRGEVLGWPRFVGAMQEALRNQKGRAGAGVHFLTAPITSPSLAALLGEILRDYPSAKWHQYDAVARPARRAGQTSTIYQFDKADVIVALDADFLSCGPGSVRYSKDFARRRRLTEENTSMSRLYAIESSPTLTGAKADHRLAVAAAEVEHVARELAAAVSGVTAAPAPSARVPGAPEIARWVAAIAKDLQAHKGRSVVVAGDFQTDAVHAAAKTINDALGQHRGDSPLRHEHRGRAGRGGNRNRRSHAGHRGRAGRTAGDHGRESGVHRSRGPALRRAPRQSPARRLLLDARRRDRATQPLAHPGDTSARKLGRCAIVRRHGHADTAADRAALRESVAVRFPRRVHRPARASRRRHRQGLLDENLQRRIRGLDVQESARRDLRECRGVLARGTARWIHGGHEPDGRRAWHDADARAALPHRQPPRRGQPPQPRPHAETPPPAPPAGAAPGRDRAERAASGTCAGGGPDRAGHGWPRNHLPPRSRDLGRPLREQRLAPGAAEAVYQDHLGPGGVDQHAARRGARPAGRRPGRAALSRQHRAHAGVRRSRTSGAVGHGVLRLRPQPQRTRRQRRRRLAAVQRVPAAHLGCPLVRQRPRAREDRRQLSAGDHAGAPLDGGPRAGPHRVARGVHQDSAGHPRAGSTPRRARSRCIPSTSTTATSGA